MQLQSSFIFNFFNLVFKSADIIFRNLLELHLALSEKIFLSQNFFLFKLIHSNPSTNLTTKFTKRDDGPVLTIKIHLILRCVYTIRLILVISYN